MQGIKKIVFITLLTLIPSIASALNFPKPTGFINDYVGAINTETSTQLTNILTQFREKTGNEIAIAVVKSLEGEPIENYAVAMYKAWGMGKKGQDNGLLLLVAPNDREMRIEVGYGLEPYINDALAGRIIRETMIPHFREGDFSLGILNGAVEIVTAISKRSGVEFDPIAAGNISSEKIYHLNSYESAKKETTFSKIFKIIFIILAILFFIKNPWLALFIFSNIGGGGGGSFRGGFGGGGFSGFGGGMSGGGGASGRW